MTAPLPIPDGPVIPADELRVEVYRASGPGGQGVNTTDSAVRLRFRLMHSSVLRWDQKQRIAEAMPSQITDDGELLVASSRHRSQHMNLEDARRRLAVLIGQHLRPPPPRHATRPTLGSQKRRMEAKKVRSGTKALRGRPSDDE
jgi:ribosome-associated protein